MKKVCSIQDIGKIVDKNFNKSTRTAISFERLNDSTIRVNTQVAKSGKIKRPDQAKKMADNVVKNIMKDVQALGFNDKFITEFRKDIVRVTDYSKSSGKVIIKKVLSPKLEQFLATSADQMETEEQLMQETKAREAQSFKETVQELEYQHAEEIGLTREQHDEIKSMFQDSSTFSHSLLNEGNTLQYETAFRDTYLDVLEDTARTFSASPNPVQNFSGTKFDNFVKFKTNQLHRLEKKVAHLKQLKIQYSNNLAVLKQLAVSEELLMGTVNDVENAIKQLKDPAQRDFNVIVFSAQSDIARAKYMVDNNTPENLAEAKEIVNFYRAAADFSKTPGKENPLFFGDDIANDIDASNIPASVVQATKAIYAQLQQVELLIHNREQQTIMTNLNNLEQIRNNPALVNSKTGLASYDDIFMTNDGLQDITLGELYFYDPGTAFVRDNGVVPQAVQEILDRAYSKKGTYVKSVVSRIDALQPRVAKILKDMGYSANILGKNVGVTWDIFRAKDANGLLRDGIVQRYTTDFLDKFNEEKESFKNRVKSALAVTDPKLKAQFLEDAHTRREKWLKKNTVMIDPSKLPEVNAAFQGKYAYTDTPSYVADLKKLLGEHGYKEEVAKQIEKIKKYEVALEIEKDKLANVVGQAFLNKMQQFANRNSPFLAAEHYEKGTYPKRGALVDYTNMNFSHFIPKNVNNFYDKNFEIIENNPDLKEFHDLMVEVIGTIQDNLTPELKNKLSTTSLPQLQKPLLEVFADPYLTTKAKMSEAFRRFIEFFRSLYSVNPQSHIDNNLVDLVTGKRLDQVNSDFLKGAKDEITKKAKLLQDKFRVANSLAMSSSDKELKSTWSNLTVNGKMFLENNLHPKQLIEIKNNPQKLFDLGKAITDKVTNDVISDSSFDLPKIAKMYTSLTMEFAARNEVLPTIRLMIEHYKNMRNPNITQQGSSLMSKVLGKPIVQGERSRANEQIESWMNRAVLGNYRKENEYKSFKNSPDNTRDSFTKADKAKLKEYDNMIESLQDAAKGQNMSKGQLSKIHKKIGYYKGQRELVGRKKSWTAVFDANFAFIRTLGLGWNVSSQITNLIEGQISNMTLGASGKYFSPQNLERANSIIMGSFMKNLSFGKLATPGAKKAAAIMRRFDVMQDATNELQRASNKNPLDNVNKVFAPFALISKVEYVNQTPVVLAMLMDQQITGKDGKTQNVWDAMNPDGSLQDNFRTPENIENWEEAKGKDFDNFKSSVGAMIVEHHGDYSKIRGNMASEQITGKAIMMFKRWATMWLQSRLAVPHVSLRGGSKGVVGKGRYRSATGTTGALTGGIFGATALSGAITSLGMVVPGLLPVIGGAVAGYYMANSLGMNSRYSGQSRQVLGVANALQESALTMKLIGLKMVGMPINIIGYMTTGKPFIDHNKQFAGDSDVNLAVDARNFRANISEIAIQLNLLLMACAVKAAWGDDPEDEDKYNLLSNRIGKLLKQTTMMFSVTDMKSLLTDFAFVRYVTNLGAFAGELAKTVGTDDLDTIKKGPNKGATKLSASFRKAFLPSLLRDKNPLSFGFASELDDYYEFNQIAILGKSEHKTEDEVAQDELKELKDQMLEQFITDDLSAAQKEKREKMIKKLFAKSKDQSYSQLYESIQNYVDVLNSAYGAEGDSSFLDESPTKKEVEDHYNIDTEGSYRTEEEQKAKEKEDFLKKYRELESQGEDMTGYFEGSDYSEADLLEE